MRSNADYYRKLDTDQSFASRMSEQQAALTPQGASVQSSDHYRKRDSSWVIEEAIAFDRLYEQCRNSGQVHAVASRAALDALIERARVEAPVKAKPSADVKRYGYRRKGDVPSSLGSPRHCGHCRTWFAARRYEQTCDGCVRPAERAKRALKTHAPNHTRGVQSLSIRAGQHGVKDAYPRLLIGLHQRGVHDGLQADGIDCRWCMA